MAGPILREALCLVSPIGSFMTDSTESKGRKGQSCPYLQMSPAEFPKLLPCGDMLASSGSSAEEAVPEKVTQRLLVTVDCHSPRLLRHSTCSLVFKQVNGVQPTMLMALWRRSYLTSSETF